MKTKQCLIRIEWGGLTSYVDKDHFELCWDGGVRIKNGDIKNLFEINPASRKSGHFFTGQTLRKLNGTTWKSRTSQGLGGVVMEVKGTSDCEINIETVQKNIAFKLKDLLKKRYIRWPVGAKYSGFSLCAMIDGEGPFKVDGEVEKGCQDLRFSYSSFKGAYKYGLFVDNQAAWILPGKEVKTEINLPRKLFRSNKKQSSILLELRASITESKNKAILSTTRYSPITVILNNKIIYSAPVYFRSEWAYWVEFIPVKIPLDKIKDGKNQLIIRNDSKKDVLGLMSAQLRESIHKDFQVESTPRWLLAGDHFHINLRCLQMHANFKIKCQSGKYCGKENTVLKPGLHYLEFIAEGGPDPIVIELSSKSKHKKILLPVYALNREEHSWKIGAIMQDENHDEASKEIEHVIKYCSDTQMGNYLQFRPEPSTVDRSNHGVTTKKQWQEWAELLKERGIYYSFLSGHVWHGYNLDNVKPDPKVYEICELMKKTAGEYFFSNHVHEYSRWIYGVMPSVEEKNWTMKNARDKYIKYVKNIELVKDVPRQTGQAVSLMSYDYEGEIDYIAVETMAMNNMHLFAAARCAARIYNKPVWGIHNATYWVKAPDDFTKLTLNWLNFYMAYTSGANFAISEDGNFHIPNADKQYGFYSEETSKLREILRQFYKYVNTHPRRGRPVVDLALAQGNNSCEIISYPLHFCWLKNQIGHAWGGMGGKQNQEKWRYGDPERGVTLIDEWMPYWQDGQHIRHWFTGTPYGQFDVTPVWKSTPEQLNQYKTLVFLGWNTMTQKIYKTLKTYVEQGGTLFMAVPHLSMHEDREFLEEMHELNMVNKGDVSDLFGVKINGAGEKITGKDEFTWTDKKYKINSEAETADIKISSAKVLIKNGKGNILLTENKLGKGKAYLLTTWAYPGCPGLENIVRDILSFLGHKSQRHIYLDDPSREVAWYVWKDDSGFTTLYFLNTDWTKQGNIKKCTLHVKNKSIPLEVKEGEITTICIKNNLAVHSVNNGVYVEDIEKKGNCYKAILNGTGKEHLQFLVLDRKPKKVSFMAKNISSKTVADNIWHKCGIDFKSSTKGVLEIK